MYKFFNYQYLFEQNPPADFKFLLPLSVFFALMLLAGIFVPFFLKRKFKQILPYKNLANKIQTEFLIISIVGLLLLFFRNQGIPYLSARVLFLALFGYFIYSVVSFLIYYKKGFLRQISEFEESQRKLKYFRR